VTLKVILKDRFSDGETFGLAITVKKSKKEELFKTLNNYKTLKGPQAKPAFISREATRQSCHIQRYLIKINHQNFMQNGVKA
jgi:hypothetical protein